MPIRESIYTIPLTDIFSEKCGCPICKAAEISEKRFADFILGAAMMEPDIRMQTNRMGFCGKHFKYLLGYKNRLSLALMMQSRLGEIEKSSGNAGKLKDYDGDCFICDKVNTALEKTVSNILTAYRNDSAFRELFREQEKICMPHYIYLCESARAMPKKDRSEFLRDAKMLFDKTLGVLKEDTDKFCFMFDYRNAETDADWGNSKDAVERCAAFFSAEREDKF